MNIINAYNANAACIMAVYITYYRLKCSLFIDQKIARAKPFKIFLSLVYDFSEVNDILRTNNSKIIGEKTQQTELYFIAQQLLNEHKKIWDFMHGF